eukprot:GHRR01007573.1.p4 GENE.GHRR01007573.1~~GHRR01007573.1.p4  ORF type:complete len:174 (+),score=52.71 GHRR01007573.1:1414-1935(+)
MQIFDCCIVESTGISLPIPVAATFALGEGHDETAGTSSGSASSSSSNPVLQHATNSSGAATSSQSDGHARLRGLADVAQLDTLVTVVDGERFVSDVLAAESLSERDMQADEEDDRTVADLLIEQVGRNTLWDTVSLGHCSFVAAHYVFYIQGHYVTACWVTLLLSMSGMPHLE